MTKITNGFLLVCLLACGTAFAQKEPADKRPPKEATKAREKEPEKPSLPKNENRVIERRGAVMAVARPRAISFTLLQMTADEIFKARPQLKEDTLNADAETIEEAVPAIDAEFRKRGFTLEDTQDAVISGWKVLRLRVLDFVQPLTQELFVKTVSGLAKLVIRTKPAGARIWIDGEPVKDKYGRDMLTEACRWPSSGLHRIRLVLDDKHTIVDEHFNIEEGIPSVIFERTLEPIKKP